FTLHASHELKTPLTIMRSEIETAIDAPETTPHARDQFVSLLDGTARLTEIVDGLIFLAKADAGLLNFQKDPVPLDELVQEAFADAQVLAAQSEIKVELTRCDRVTISAERHRIRQLLLILTDNAIKYNKPHGAVLLEVQLNGAAEIRVSNTGFGISSDELPRIFDRFFRGRNAIDHRVEGCGLGLSLARSIAVAHDAQFY